jgi:hypothetical protein
MLKKVGVQHLRLGMYIHELCGSWMDHPFWRTKFLLDDMEDIRRLRESAVAEVWIDTSKGHDITRQETLAEAKDEAEVIAETERTLISAAESEIAPTRVAMVEEIARAKKICDKSKQAVVSMFQEVRMGPRRLSRSGGFSGR